MSDVVNGCLSVWEGHEDALDKLRDFVGLNDNHLCAPWPPWPAVLLPRYVNGLIFSPFSL